MLIPILATEALMQTEGKATGQRQVFLPKARRRSAARRFPLSWRSTRTYLACDMVISADGGQWAEDQPGLSVAFKGLCALQINVEGPDHDLHSGMRRLRAQPHPRPGAHHRLDAQPGGKIMVDGFYDDVRPLTADEQTQIERIPFGEEEYVPRAGVDGLFGEPGFTTLQRGGAYAGSQRHLGRFPRRRRQDGAAQQGARQDHTCRLVADQKPAHILDLLEAHIAKVTPPGVRDGGRALSTAHPR